MDASNMLTNTVDIVAFARSKGLKIVHVGITFSDEYYEISNNPYGILKGVKEGKCFTASGWGGEFCKEVTPQPGDIIVQGKRGLCGFASTNLDFILRQNGVETMAIAGFLTNW
jgi:ureidoacrylate peracid hydrolase